MIHVVYISYILAHTILPFFLSFQSLLQLSDLSIYALVCKAYIQCVQYSCHENILWNQHNFETRYEKYVKLSQKIKLVKWNKKGWKRIYNVICTSYHCSYKWKLVIWKYSYGETVRRNSLILPTECQSLHFQERDWHDRQRHQAASSTHLSFQLHLSCEDCTNTRLNFVKD